MKKDKKTIAKGLSVFLVLLLAAVLALPVVQAAPAKSLRKAAVQLEKTSFVWTGKAIRPKVTLRDGKKTLKKGRDYTIRYRANKAVGTASIQLTGKGRYTGSVKKSFRIVPKRTALSGVKGSAYGLTVQWKAQKKQTSGYQIQYSKKSKFTSKSPVTTVSGKGKKKTQITGLDADTTYYVRIRTFKKVKKKTYVSAWSKAVKTKTLPDERNPLGQKTEPSEAEVSMAKVNAEMALQILRERLAADGSENILVSPLSLYEDLALAACGAKGKTCKELEAYLGGSVSETAARIAAYNEALPSSLHVANSIWINERFGAPTPEFQQNAAKQFQAEVSAVPYDEGTVRDINNWVNKHTDGMIPSLVDQLFPDEVMHLINAVAFESEWKRPYEYVDISSGQKFTNAAGSKEDCVLLHSTEAELLTLKAGDGTLLAQGFLKPYSDGKTAFLGLLPEQGKTPKDILNELNGERYASMYQGRELYRNGHLYAGIPEFSLDDKMELKPILEKAGVKEAFLPSADFSGMMQEISDLYIGSVLQKTHIEVDRHGTKAAAATDIAVKAGCAMGQQDLPLILNRPFLYAIVDYPSGLPIFMGVENHIK